jgi:molecular chaperone Hsp33
MALSSGDSPEGTDVPVAEHDDWVKARLLLDTAEAHELLDPTLSPEGLLYRLYHDDGVTVYPAIDVQRYCSCSQDGVRSMLLRFPEGDRADMIEDGAITVTCEFCSTAYRFAPGGLGRP